VRYSGTDYIHAPLSFQLMPRLPLSGRELWLGSVGGLNGEPDDSADPRLLGAGGKDRKIMNASPLYHGRSEREGAPNRYSHSQVAPVVQRSAERSQLMPALRKTSIVFLNRPTC
jgi:hypothetical protein